MNSSERGAHGKHVAVIYHGACVDGFGGAWAAWKKFGNRAAYYGLSHHDPPPALRGKFVYLVDFNFDVPVVKRLIRENAQVTAIDHHVTREVPTKLTTDYRYALDRSGAVLAWQYFHPGEPLPWLLRRIEDIDLWKFRLSGTREAHAALQQFDFDFRVWDRLVREFERPASRRRHLDAGKVILRYEEKMVADLAAENAQTVEFEGYASLAVNTPKLANYLGNRLTELLPPIGIVWSERKNAIHVSLRSNGTVDVAKLAARFPNGGGHKAAAGFSLPLGSPLPWKRVKEMRDER